MSAQRIKKGLPDESRKLYPSDLFDLMEIKEGRRSLFDILRCSETAQNREPQCVVEADDQVHFGQVYIRAVRGAGGGPPAAGPSERAQQIGRGRPRARPSR